jgi:type II secretory pathway pseudopilin PulG
MKTRMKREQKNLKSEPGNGFRISPLSAFSLLEMLVASAILALLLLVFLSVSDYASKAWKGSQEKMEEFSTARIVMNRLRADVETIVLRPDLPLFPGNVMGFMTVKRGVISDPRLLSYVEYGTNANNQLTRASRAYAWDDPPPFSTNSVMSAPATTTTNSLADGVVGFQTTFLNKDGTWSTSFVGTNSIAVRVSLLVVSRDGLKLLGNTGKLSALAGAVALTPAQATDPDKSPEEVWDSLISTGSPGIDPMAARSLRAFERLFFLPSPK